MPSLAISCWLIFAAAAAADPPSSPRAREPAAPSSPGAPTATPPRAPAKPSQATAPKPPAAPAGKPAAASKTSAPTEESVATVDEPEEEIIAGKSKDARRPARKAAPTSDRNDIPERKASWSTDRYAAVVPPGLTLAALRSQLAKAQAAPLETAAPAPEQSPTATLAEIERAREALRQETARLEALLKASGNCGGGGGGGMPIGDGLATPTVLPPTALREAPAEQIDSVSKAIKGMKPEQAAALVARLDRALAAEIMRKMKPVDAGAILGLLKPELAAELATQIATRKSTFGKDKKGNGK